MKSKTRLFEAALVLFAILLATQGEAIKFEIFKDKKTWDDANKFCISKGGFLAIVDTNDTRKQLTDKLTDDKNYWIGLKINSSGVKHWINGSAFNDDSVQIKGKCNKTDCCVYFKKKKDNKKKDSKKKESYEFHAKKCNDKKPEKFICQDVPGNKTSLSSSHIQKTTSHSIITTSRATNTPLPESQTSTPSSKLLLSTSTPSSKILLSTATPSSKLLLSKSTPSSKILLSTATPSFKLLLSTISTKSTLCTTVAPLNTIRAQTSTKAALVTNISPVMTPLNTFSAVPTTSSIVPTTTSTSYSRGKTMVHDFHTFMETLNASDPGSMEKLLKKFDDVMGAIDPTIMTEEDFNPLLEAHSIETFAMAYTKMHLNSNKTSMKLDSEIIAYQAKVVHRSTNSNVILAPDDEDTNRNFITMPKELFQNEDEVIVVGVVFKNDKNNTLRRLTPKIFKGIPNSARLNTKMVSLSTYPKLKEPFEDNILFTLQHIQVNATNNPLEVHCSFWNFSIPTSHNGSWSERGCRVKSTTDTYTVCECNHMTNFAVLMQLKPEKKIAKKHQIALTAITYVGLVLSLVGEAVTVLCYCIFLNVHNVKIQIRINLLCALAGAQIVMLGGIAQTEHKGVCVLVAALIHYLYLASFCWMFMEAVYLHRLVVKVFDVGLKMRIFYLLAYGCPGVMVLLAVLLAEMCTGGIYTYCNPHYCWVNFKNKLIWSFVAPVLLIVTTNSVLLFCVIKEMFSMKTVKTIGSAELSMIRASVRACVVLLPLLGITWVFGLLSLADIGIAWQYIFTILNATQGFMIFIFHCVRNSELKAAISLRIHQWESNNSNNHSKGRVTPTKLNRETKSSQESPRGSVPMVTAITNKVMPENTI